MECALRITHSSMGSLPKIDRHFRGNSRFFPKIGYEIHRNGAVLLSSSSFSTRAAATNVHRLSSNESKFCYDKPIPEEIIEKPDGLSLDEKNVGESPRCASCQTKGAILCTTCSGSGLYVESILESQGIIVVVEQGILCVQNVVAGVTFDLSDIYKVCFFIIPVASSDVKS
ncbi:hypothetical protein BUALT_Bualt12G0050700 [Buddleja alternifolia]|uniref:DnaJ/Hsp40 cysteine-rich domain superfamily protein n=1 Tax=Buddleja alternifolia TaxID=168488 RepID=A0AAV6WQ23_9LAMI|nr:hypothetical protein BUALT_Bualt12G0050700 [Buddleja alternifolia]